MKHEAAANLEVTADAAAGAKVGAKGESHFSLLETGSEEPPQMWAAPRPAPRMAIPGKRRR